MMKSKRNLILWTVVSVIFFGMIFAYEEGFSYPERDIVCVVPFKPGGGSDLIARSVSRHLRNYLPKPVNIIVQNVDAAGGRVGCFMVYDAKPDGYMFGVLEPTIFIMAEAMGELGKRDLRRMTWLHRAVEVPYMFAVSPQSPIKSIGDLKGKKIRASASHSTLTSSVSILKFLGSEPYHIIYAGGAESCLATMRGDTDVVVQAAATVLRQAEASGGKLIPLVLFAESRLPVAPNIPTAKELGITFPDDLKMLLSYDYIFAAPYGLPADVYKILSEGITKTLRDPNFAEDMKKTKLTVSVLTPEEMQKRMETLHKIVPQYMEVVRQALGK